MMIIIIIRILIIIDILNTGNHFIPVAEFVTSIKPFITRVIPFACFV